MCDKSFLYQSKLNEHIITHTKIRYQCNNCNQLIKRKDHFDIHVLKCSSSLLNPLYDITNAGDVFFEVSVNSSDVLPSMVETVNNGDSIQLLYNGRILMSDNTSPMKSTK